MNATHRTTRILNHIAGHPGGCSNAEIVAVVHRTEPDVKPVLIGTLAHYLVSAGKLTTTGSYGTRRFFPVPAAPVDRRVRATDAAARTPAKAGKKAKLAALEKAPATGPTGPLDSAAIARDIAAFKRSGGKVEKLPDGHSSQPLLGIQSLAATRPHGLDRPFIRANTGNL